MKRKIFILISIILIISLCLPTIAQASEAFNVYPIIYLPRQLQIVSSDVPIQETDENICLIPANLNEQTLHVKSTYYGENNGVSYGVNFPINFTSDSQNLTTYSTSNLYIMNFEFEVYPISYKSGKEKAVSTRINKIIRNQGADDEETYYPAGTGIDSVSRYQPNGDMSIFYKTTFIENPEITDFAYGCYTFHITMVIRLSSVASLRTLFFDIALSSLFEAVDEAVINIHPATTSKLVVSDLDDIDSSIKELNNIVNEIYTLLGEINGNGNDITLGDIANSSSITVDELIDIRNNLLELNDTMDNMSDSVGEGVGSALDEQKEKLEDEALEKMDEIVDNVQEGLDIDISAIKNSFQNLYDSITTHETDAKLTFPAGRVTIGENEYTFWEETEVDFEPYFEYPIVQTLLVPLRFVMIVGFGYFMLNQVKKIESIVTMNSGGDE